MTTINLPSPDWPSLYDPFIDIRHIPHNDPVQKSGHYLNNPHDIFRFTLYWTLIFYLPIFILAGLLAFLNIIFPPTSRRHGDTEHQQEHQHQHRHGQITRPTSYPHTEEYPLVPLSASTSGASPTSASAGGGGYPYPHPYPVSDTLSLSSPTGSGTAFVPGAGSIPSLSLCSGPGLGVGLAPGPAAPASAVLLQTQPSTGTFTLAPQPSTSGLTSAFAGLPPSTSLSTAARGRDRARGSRTHARTSRSARRRSGARIGTRTIETQTRAPKGQRQINPHRSRAVYALIVLPLFLSSGLLGAVLGSVIVGYVLAGLYKAGGFFMSTWIPPLFALVQTLIGVLGIYPSIAEII